MRGSTRSSSTATECRFTRPAEKSGCSRATATTGLGGSLSWPLKLAALPACIIDAELVATEEHGIADFATLQRTVSKRQEDGLALWAFDLLHAGGGFSQGLDEADLVGRRDRPGQRQRTCGASRFT
jgi:hypothetical protein